MAVLVRAFFKLMDYAVIAPHYDNLPHLPAVASTMASALGCDPLLGNVTAAMLRQYLRDQSLIGLYFGGHASGGELYLSGDEHMAAAEFAGILANCMRIDEGDCWVFLAACESDAFLHALQSVAAVDVATSVVSELPDVETRAIELNIAETLRQNGGDLAAAIHRHKYQMLPYFRYWTHLGNAMNGNRNTTQSQGGGLYEQIAENRLAIKYQERRVDELSTALGRLRAEFEELERGVAARGGGMAIYNHPATQPTPYNDSQLIKFVIAVIVIGLVFGAVLFVALKYGGV